MRELVNNQTATSKVVGEHIATLFGLRPGDGAKKLRRDITSCKCLLGIKRWGESGNGSQDVGKCFDELLSICKTKGVQFSAEWIADMQFIHASASVKLAVFRKCQDIANQHARNPAQQKFILKGPAFSSMVEKEKAKAEAPPQNDDSSPPHPTDPDVLQPPSTPTAPQRKLERSDSETDQAEEAVGSQDTTKPCNSSTTRKRKAAGDEQGDNDSKYSSWEQDVDGHVTVKMMQAHQISNAMDPKGWEIHKFVN